MENRTHILNELQGLSPTLATIEKTNVFTVPEGYFECLVADILMGIETENGSANNAAACKDIPTGYFDRLAASILTKIKTEEAEDAALEIRALSPMLYSIQNENVFEVPSGYFDGLSHAVLNSVNPPVKVVSMKRRTTVFIKYAVAAVFTGVMALGVFKFTGKPAIDQLPDYVTAGLKVQDVDQELAKISDTDIIKYLEANGTDVKTALVVGSTDNNELPSEEDYLLDEKALDKYLNSINVDNLKN
jgi:hypothetical protein